MKLGLFLETHWAGGADPARRLAEMLEQVRAARDCGFESIWLAQHFLTGPGGMFQAMPLLGRLIPEVPGLRLATSILLLPLLNPVQLAEEAATLDHLTGGRFMLGVGLGHVDHEFRAFGVDRRRRVGRFVEAIEVMRKLWTGEKVTHLGRHHQLDGVQASVVPARPGGVPILIGASADPAVERAARIGDGWLITFVSDLPTVKRQLAMFRETRRAAGLPPPPEQVIGRECHVGATRAAAVAEAGPALLAKHRRAGEDAEAFLRDRCLVGDEAFVRDEMNRYRAELGVDLFRLRLQWPGIEHAQVLKSIERAGRAAFA